MNTSPNAPSSRVPVLNGWFVVILTALCATVALAFGRFSYGALLPAVRDDMGISNTLAGLIGGANVGAYLAGTFLMSWLAGRFKLVGILRLGLLLVVVGLLIAGLSTSLWALAFALALAGLGGALVWIPAPVIAADAIAENKRPLAVGMMSSGIGVGIVLVSTISGSFRESLGDAAWATIYQVQFAVGLVVMILVFLLVRHSQSAPQGGGGIGGFAALQRMPGWLPLSIAYGCFGFMYLLVMGFLTSRLEDDSGWSTADASLAFSVMGVSMIFGGPLLTTIAQRLGVRLVLAVSFGLWPVFSLVLLTGLPVAVFLASAALGFLFSALPALITFYVVENTKAKDYGASFAAATLVFGLAQAVSPPIGGWIADTAGSFAPVFILSAVTSLIGVGATLGLPRNG